MDYKGLIERLNSFSAEHQQHGGITAEAADAIETLLKERSAAIEILRGECGVCKNDNGWGMSALCESCKHWEWAKENAKSDNWEWCGLGEDENDA